MQVRLLTVEDECIFIRGGGSDVDTDGNEGQYNFIECICVALPYRPGGQCEPKSVSHFRITR